MTGGIGPGEVRPLHALAAVAATALTVVVAASAEPTSAPVPRAATPVSLKYSGTFDMSNTLAPQSTPSSYAYHVEWVYFWSGRWGQLFADKSRFTTNATPWAQRTVTGHVDIVFREKVDGPNLRCKASVVEDRSAPAVFSLGYDTSAGTLQANVTAPTFQGSRIVVQKGANGSKPGCTGGPGVNVFSAPASFNPLGQGAKVSLRSGGTRRYDKTWRWSQASSGAKRTYTAAIHTELAVVVKPR
jgi:hypothetical protein